MRGRRGGGTRGPYQGRGRNTGRGGQRKIPVGANEADSLKCWKSTTISTNSNINFTSLWRGAKSALQNEYGDATKVLLRMEVDTEDPQPDPLPEMPRRANYGDNQDDDRLFQDDLNAWRESKQDFLALDKEYKKQRRELNQKLEQIKNVTLSKRDQDVQDFLESTHTRDVLHQHKKPTTMESLPKPKNVDNTNSLHQTHHQQCQPQQSKTI